MLILKKKGLSNTQKNRSLLISKTQNNRFADTTASNNIKSFEAQANASITNATLRIISIKY